MSKNSFSVHCAKVGQIASIEPQDVQNLFSFFLFPHLSSSDEQLAPSDLRGFSQVFSNLAAITPFLLEIKGEGDISRGNFHPGLKTILLYGDRLGDKKAIQRYRSDFDSERPKLGKKDINIVHGRKTKTPFFSALVIAPPPVNHRNFYWQLLSHIVLAMSDLAVSKTNVDTAMNNTLDETFEACRGLCKQHSELLMELPLGVSNRTVFHGELFGLVEKSRMEPQWANFKYLAPIERFLRRALSFFPVTNHSQQRYSPLEPSPFDLDAYEDFEDEGPSDPEKILQTRAGIQFLPVRDDEPEDQLKELGPKFEIVAAETSDVGGKGGWHLRRSYSRIKLAAHRMGVSNQNFWFANEELTPYEISCLVGAINANLEKTTKDLSPKALLSIMLFSGSDLETSLGIRLVQDPKDFRGAPLRLLRREEGLILLRKAPRLLKKYPRSKVSFRHDTMIELPLGETAVKVINAYLDSSSDQCLKGYLFPLRQETVAEARSFLRKLNRQKLLQITLARVSNYMVRQLAREPGSDIASAMYMSGRKNFWCQSRMHYTAHSQERMRTIFENVILRIESTAVGVKQPHVQVPPRTGIKSSVIGTPYRPTYDAISDMVSSLKGQITYRRKGIDFKSGRQLRDFHFFYTLYTCLFVNFASTFRAVHDPSFKPSEYDPQTGFAVLRDKDSQDGYNTRLIWIWDECLKQLDAYRSHLEKLHSLYVPFRRLLKDAEWCQRGGDRSSSYFLILDNKQFDFIAPGIFQKHLDNYLKFSLPANCHRHYLRSELIESGCSLDVVDAFLGHWSRGEEPWSRFSGLSPIVFARELKEHLEPILEKNQWASIAGLGKVKK